MEYRLLITMADPAGNRTAFVEGPAAPEDYAAIGAAILKEYDLRAEQAGFLCPPLAGGAGRLEMMGGEFCGNAARSFGLLLGRRAGKKAGDTVPVEISGSSSVLDVLLEENGAWISMPLPKRLIAVEAPDGDGNILKLPAVVLEGITHVILENRKVSETLARAVIEKAAADTNADAVGAIFTDGVHMTPAVWVRATDSFIWESSCGSGTLAATIWLGRNVEDGEFDLELIQPGGILNSKITKKGGAVTNAQIGGPVFLEEPIIKTITI